MPQITPNTLRRAAVDRRALVLPRGFSSLSELMATFAFAMLALVALVASTPSRASFHTYQINEIYTNLDGTLQFIELKEAFGAGGQHFLRGLTITSGSGANTKSFTFPNNLPSANTGVRWPSGVVSKSGLNISRASVPSSLENSWFGSNERGSATKARRRIPPRLSEDGSGVSAA